MMHRLIFTAGRAMLSAVYAVVVCPCVRPSVRVCVCVCVCVSVTLRYCIKTATVNVGSSKYCHTIAAGL